MKTSGTMNSATGHTSVSTRTGNFNDGLYDKAGARPDLDLDFARTKSLKDRVSKEDLITFSRNTSTDSTKGATYVDENGLVKVASRNLISRSEAVTITGYGPDPQIDGTSNTYTDNNVIAPDGSLTAGTWTGDADQFAILYGRTNGTNAWIRNIIDFDHVDLGWNITSEWQRFYYPFTYPSDGNGSVVPYILRESGGGSIYFAGISGLIPNSDYTYSAYYKKIGTKVYYWGGQINLGSTPTEYVRTQGIASGAPRFTHDPETLESRGLLIEQQATNLTYPSVPNQDGSGSGLWNGERTTRTYNAATAPDGTNTALLFTQDTTATTSHYVRANHMVTLTDNTDYTFSCFVKKPPTNGNRYVFIALHGRGYRHYDLQDGVLTFANDDGTASNLHGSITAYPNDWYKLTYTINTSSNNSVAGRIYIGHSANGNTHSFTGDGTSGLLVWGTQLEQGAFATSYIPTSATSTVIRSPDLASIEGDNFGTYRQNIKPNTVPNNVTYTTASGSSSSTTNTKINLQPYVAKSPYGTYDASLITENNESGVHELKNPLEIHLLNSTVYTVSCYVKEPPTNSRRYVGIALWGNDEVVFDIQNGTYLRTEGTRGIISHAITSVGNGWYRISMVLTSRSDQNTAARSNVYAILDNGTAQSYAGDGTKGMYVWGFQVELGNTLTEFIPSTDRFTNRQSTATFVDGNGIIRKSYINQLLYSEDYTKTVSAGTGGMWQIGLGSMSVDNNVRKPDGTFGAFKYTPNTTNNRSHILYNARHLNDSLVLSAYVKAAGLTHVSLISQKGASDSRGVSFDLTTQTIQASQNATGEIIDVGDGWYRIIVIPTTVVGNITFWILHPHKGDTPRTDEYFRSPYAQTTGETKGMYIWGAMLQDKSTEVGDYAKTEGTYTGAARYSHDPDTLTPTGLYLEPAAANLIHYSQDFTQNDWDKDQTTVTANATTAPDGTNTATLVFADHSHGHGSHRVRDPGHNLGPHQYTFSVFVKAGTTDSIALQMYKTGIATILNKRFFLSDGTIGDSGTGTAKITKYPNGWYRIEGTTIPDTNTATTSTVIIIHKDATSSANYEVPNDGSTVSAYLWGAQLEQSTSSTSYIPTSGEEANRNADIFKSTATEVLDRANGTKPAFYTKSGLTAFVGAQYNNVNGTSHQGSRVFGFSTSSTVADFQITQSWTNHMQIYQNTDLGTGLTSFDISKPVKVAGRYDLNNTRLAANGSLSDLDDNHVIRSSIKLEIGKTVSNTDFYANGTIQRLTFWKTPFVDSKLERITQIIT